MSRATPAATKMIAPMMSAKIFLMLEVVVYLVMIDLLEVGQEILT